MWFGLANEQMFHQFAMFNLLGTLYTKLYNQMIMAYQQGLHLVTAIPRMEQCGHRMKNDGEPPCIEKSRVHPRPIYTDAQSSPHGAGAAANRHKQAASPTGRTRSLRTLASRPQRPGPRQGAPANNQETNGPAPNGLGKRSTLYCGGPHEPRHHPGGQYPGSGHGHVG